MEERWKYQHLKKLRNSHVIFLACISIQILKEFGLKCNQEKSRGHFIYRVLILDEYYNISKLLRQIQSVDNEDTNHLELLEYS